MPSECAGQPQAFPASAPSPYAGVMSAGGISSTGTVVDDVKAPVNGAEIGIINRAHSTHVFELETDDQRMFDVAGLEAGSCTFVVSRLGFKSQAPRNVDVLSNQATE